MRILHVITGLNLGGAEVMLARLLRASAHEGATREVISLTSLGVIADRLRPLGVPVHAVGMGRLPDPAALARLAALARRFRPDVVQTWMYHADLLGGLAARLGTDARVVWGIHNNALDPADTRRTTRWTARLCARLSRRVPDRIVCVSRAARDLHVALGYAAERCLVVPNGFDLDEFRPDAARRREARAELDLDEGAVAFGLVARVHPQKDHATFLRAAALLAAREPAARFVLCGAGTAPGDALARAVGAAGLTGRFRLLGAREDVPRLLCALDVACLSSTSEAFPLSLGEAMATGVPCVATDVGDCALLVGDAGRVVPARDPAALAAAWEELVRLGRDGRARLGAAARARIAARFGIGRAAEAYARLYRSLCGGAAELAGAQAR